MSDQSVSFQTRARTIDHLGRGQIADLPTAVTELWKNAYDAYAQDVSLHIFKGTPEIATIFDDGCGMTRSDFIDRWLVIGTESKIEAKEETEEERFGQPKRPRQGEKGIGRLSAAFIAPVTLAISKKQEHQFAAALVDWRLFENPFLSLQDILVPVREFGNPGEIKSILPEMIVSLKENVAPVISDDRYNYVLNAWNRFTKYEKNFSRKETTKEEIENSLKDQQAIFKCLDEWIVFAGLKDHGTALIMVGIQEELAAWVRPETPDAATKVSMDSLRDTLNSFTDSLSNPRLIFDYEVWAHKEDGNRRIIGTDDVFGYDDFMGLEHSIYGTFDENGIFTGEVIAFGKKLGEKKFTPKHRLSSDYRGRIGPFGFCIGTFEQYLSNSTHSDEQHKKFSDKSDEYGGLRIYRDGLRVMPYGRPDADFFDVEERRTKHAGREFWSYRRSFGRVSICSEINSNLKDKAGREGLVDNRARRDLRLLVIGLLQDFARRYFGSDSHVRQKELPDIQKRNAAAKKAAEKARKRRRTSLRRFLKDNFSELKSAIENVNPLEECIINAKGPDDLALTSTRIKDLVEKKSFLRPPPAPAKNDNLESKYRDYRDGYNELTACIDRLSALQSEMEAEFGASSPKEAAQSAFSSRQSRLTSRVDGYLRRLKNQSDTLFSRWSEEANEDRAKYYTQCIDLLNEDPDVYGLVELINLLDVRFRELEEDFSIRYESYSKALDQLEAGVDLDGALEVADYDLIKLEEHVENLNAVAQLGITVEIIGHELETMDEEARRNLKRLPEDVKKTAAYKSAFESLAALTERLRFLAPMKIAGYRAIERITGAEIANYIEEFFGHRFRDDRIEFNATAAFKEIEVSDLRSRIYPTFINLVNNAAYWVNHSVDRQILLDAQDGHVIIADSGPGVDRDDIDRLFTLFFTRKQGGRGVGLFLAKANLAVGNHKIWYATEHDQKILRGANFVVKFRGGDDD